MRGRIKVILVDNDSDELYFMAEGFESAQHYEILARCSGWSELLTFLETAITLPDVIITDLNMPEKSGIEIASEIKLSALFNSIRVVVLSITSREAAEQINATFKTKGYLFLPKPMALLEYQSFALTLYDRLNSDLFSG